MQRSTTFTSLYEKYKEERQNYRLELDIKRHNWLFQKIAAGLPTLNKRNKKLLKRLKKNMMKYNAKVPRIHNKNIALQRSLTQVDLTEKRKTKSPIENSTFSSVDPSMPDLSEIFAEIEIVDNPPPPYQEEPLALLHKIKINEIVGLKRIHDENKNNPVQIMEQEPNSWLEPKKQILNAAMHRDRGENKRGYQLRDPRYKREQAQLHSCQQTLTHPNYIPLGQHVLPAAQGVHVPSNSFFGHDVTFK